MHHINDILCTILCQGALKASNLNCNGFYVALQYFLWGVTGLKQTVTLCKWYRKTKQQQQYGFSLHVCKKGLVKPHVSLLLHRVSG